MHPGWFVFMAAYGSGIFTTVAMAFAVRWMMGWDRLNELIIAVVIAVFLFIIGGRRAEKLWDRS